MPVIFCFLLILLYLCNLIMETRQLILSPAESRIMEHGFRVVRRSVDARQRDIRVLLTVLSDEKGNLLPREADVPLYQKPVFPDVSGSAHEALVVGAGPAGLFAALTLVEHGIRPVIIERGREVSARKRDIARLNRNMGLDPSSNYCFGEGGAGTFSDGKLFSRSKKRGDMQRVMELFHFFGAPDTVLYETHAHIGSDLLPAIIRHIRECLCAHGAEFRFGTLFDRLDPSVPTVLAIGHSAHDTYRLLAQEGVAMEAKGCAMGVRVEHPQALINRLMYHLAGRPADESAALVENLGNASYSLVTQVSGTGVYSFCMCPGGHIVPAASAPETVIVNGMSARLRNSPYANSGIVVSVPPVGHAMQALAWQESLEHGAWLQAREVLGSRLQAQAPAQRLADFVDGRVSADLPACSFLPGIVPSRLDRWLPPEIGAFLRRGFRDFDRKYPGFLTNDAVVLGVESRTSSPVRLLRDPVTMQSLSHPFLYPCGEGAGYAGGITSSALDGIRAALQLCSHVQSNV